MPSFRIGDMKERLTIQRNTPLSLSISSLTRVSTTATAVTTSAHGFIAGDYATIAGSSIAGWNAKVKVVTVPTTTSFTFTVSGSLTTPATGTITVVYAHNASTEQGANGASWTTLYQGIAAEMIPLSTQERLQLQAVQSVVQYRFRIWTLTGILAGMRVLWSQSWVAGQVPVTLVLSGAPLPDPDNTRLLFLECSVVPT